MGLEEYVGMSDSMKLATLCVKVDGIEDRLDRVPPCPSTRCLEHDRRLTTLETKRETEATVEDRHGDSVIAWIGIIIAAVSVLVAIYAVTGGG